MEALIETLTEQNYNALQEKIPDHFTREYLAELLALQQLGQPLESDEITALNQAGL